MKISDKARQRIRLYFQDRKERAMNCACCGRMLRDYAAIEVELEHYMSPVMVCSLECRNEWLAGYAEEVREALEGLEVTE